MTKKNMPPDPLKGYKFPKPRDVKPKRDPTYQSKWVIDKAIQLHLMIQADAIAKGDLKLSEAHDCVKDSLDFGHSLDVAQELAYQIRDYIGEEYFNQS